MSLFGFVKDVVMLPVDAALDVTGVTPMARIASDSRHDQPFGTLDRLESIVKNVDDTLK